MNTLHLGDCLTVLPTLPDASIDLVLCDLPYGQTRCQWDSVIPLEPLWSQYQRLLSPHGTVVLTASLRFAAQLLSTCPKNWFRYDLIWDKVSTTGYLDARRRPLRQHELILVFAPSAPRYFPQMSPGVPYSGSSQIKSSDVYGTRLSWHTDNDGTRYPTSVVRIPSGRQQGKLHPTQKPVALFEYLLKTFSQPGEVVLDNACGSGTTLLACQNLGREGIGIELDATYFGVAKERLDGIEVPSLL